MEAQNNIYLRNRQAVIYKLEPPVVFRKKRETVVFRKHTPFDFMGVLNGGRAIAFETKCSKHNRLPIRAEGHRGSGLQWHQLVALLDFKKMGGITFVLWLCTSGEYRTARLFIVNEDWKNKKSLEYDRGYEVDGVDYLPVLYQYNIVEERK